MIRYHLVQDKTTEIHKTERVDIITVDYDKEDRIIGFEYPEHLDAVEAMQRIATRP